MRIASCQLRVVPADPAGNADRAVDAAAAAFAEGAELVLLPETCTSGLPFADQAEARSSGSGARDRLLDRWAALVQDRERVLVAGFAELGDDGCLYNSAVLLDGAGGRAIYRKTHLWDAEKLFFTPGSATPPVVDTAFGRIGLMICYDMEFPEMTRAAALAGAELLAVPTAWPVVPHPAGQPTFEVIAAQAAARVNRMAVVTCDRSGVTRGQEWTGGTVIIGADGWIAGRPDHRGVARADLDLSAFSDKSLTPLAHLFDDRRPELYRSVSLGHSPTRESSS